uniref:heme oxygenase (biliverdin-producing) n=1 Tax=Wollemia nobilis TaxID=56998 RepID=A0A0C9QRB6_9CONI
MPVSVSQTFQLQMASSSYAKVNELPTSKPVFPQHSYGQTKLLSPRRQVSFPESHRSHNIIAISSKFAKSGQGRKALGVVEVRAAATAEKAKKYYPEKAGGFVEEMRNVAMRLHTRDVAKEGQKEPDAQPIGKWEPTVEGYIRFLVDSKLVYETLESLVQEEAHPVYAEFRNTGLERTEKLAKDLEWFRQQGYSIPEPSSPGTSYAKYLQELSEQDPPAFICHFYNFYFAHTAGGRMIGKSVAEKILDGKELEFYKWDRNIKELLNGVREKLNKVAEGWSREEKNHCLEETEMSFEYSGKLLRLIIS